jgi:phage-related protein
MKLVEDFDGDTYRAAYTVAFPGVAYVLDVFQKKSVKGKATPQVDKDRVERRFKAAKEHYENKYRDAKGSTPR